MASRQTRPPLARMSVPVAAGLRRPRVLDKVLAKLVAGGGPALVIAPAGTGKTTLLAAVAERWTGPVAWYRADTRTDAAALVGHLRLCLEPGSQSGEDVEALLLDLEGLPPDPPVLLVIDDVHTLADAVVLGVLEPLLMSLPANVRVLLGSRRDPPIDLTRAELSPSPLTVSADDLRFRTWEVEALFRDAYQVPLRPGDAAALTRLTEGWAAALHLFHLATRDSSSQERHRAIGTLASHHRYARGFLSRLLLAGLPPELGDFLRRTSVLEVLSGERCDALLGRTDSQSQLERLVQRTALTSTDDGGQTFRYHEVLRHHLESQLHEQLGSTSARAWYRRAAEVLDAEGATAESIRVRALAHDWDGVHRLLMTHEDVPLAGAPAWTGVLPETLVREDPLLAVAQGKRLLRDGRLRAAERVSADAARATDDSRAREEARRVVRRVQAWSRPPPFPVTDWVDAAACVLRGIVREPSGPAGVGPADGRSGAWSLVRALEGLVEGNRGLAEERLAQALAEVEVGSSEELAARLTLVGMNVLLDDVHAFTDADHLATDAERAGWPWFSRAARVLAVAALGHRASSPAARAVLEECRAAGDDWGALLAGLAECVLELRRDDPDLRLFELVMARAQAVGAAPCAAWVAAAGVLARARIGVPVTSEWLARSEQVALSGGSSGAEAVFAWAAATLDAAGRASGARRAQTVAAALGWSLPPLTGDAGGEATPSAAVDGPPSLQVQLLGGLVVVVGGHSVDLSSVRPKARSVLRLLALDVGHPVHRDRLAQAFWPSLASTTATHNLQVSVSSLRALLEGTSPGGGGLLTRQGSSYRLGRPGASSDLTQLGEAMRRGRDALAARRPVAALAALREAAELTQHDLLPEEGTAEWVEEHRERLKLRLADLGEGVARALADVDPMAADEAAVTCVEADPYREGCWRLLLRVRRERGDRASLRRAEEGYRARMAELGVST